jgi:hypothetical protein
MIKMKRIFLIFLLLIVFCTSSGVTAANSAKCAAIELIDGARAYNNLVCNGIASMNAKRYKQAIVTLTEALNTPLHEIPNFALYSRLSMLYFLNGDTAEAEVALAKAELSLSVLFGIVECAETDDGFKLRRRGGGFVNSRFEKEITQRMCGAAYEYFYQSKTLEDILQDAKLLQYYLSVRRQIQSK